MKIEHRIGKDIIVTNSDERSIKDISFDDLIKLYREAQANFYNGENFALTLHIFNKYDGKSMRYSFFYEGEDSEFENGKEHFRSNIIGEGEYFVALPRYHGQFRRVDNAHIKNCHGQYKKFIKNLEAFDHNHVEEIVSSRPDLLTSLIGVENPMIDSNYYVGQGVVLNNIDDVMCAIDSAKYHHDGAIRNAFIREFQKLPYGWDYDARLELSEMEIQEFLND